MIEENREVPNGKPSAATKLKIKVPQTMEEAAKLRNGLERVMHQTPRPALNFLCNVVYQIKATEDLADLLRPAKQAAIAWQLERYAEALTAAPKAA